MDGPRCRPSGSGCRELGLRALLDELQRLRGELAVRVDAYIWLLWVVLGANAAPFPYLLEPLLFDDPDGRRVVCRNAGRDGGVGINLADTL